MLGDVEHGHDIRRSREPRGGERLSRKRALRVLLARVAVGEQLDRDRPLQDGVGRTVDLAHAATRDERGRGISPGKHAAADSSKVPVPPNSDTRSAQQEAVAERIVRVEREDVLARAVRAALDLGDHRREARDLGVAARRGRVNSVSTMLR